MSQFPPAGPPPAPAPPPPSPQWGQPPAAGTSPYAAPKTDGTAVAALILSIASWVACPVVAAIVALALAHVSANKIDASGGRLTGLGLVTAAKIVAWIHLVLITVAMVIAAIVLVAVDSA